MANTTTLPGDLVVNGNLRITGSLSPAMGRTNLAEDSLQPFAIKATDWKTWDNMAVTLPTDGATDDLGLIEGTWATASPSLQTGDAKQTNVPFYARAQVPLPMEYQAGQSVTLRLHAGMLTTVSDTTATLDVVCYKSDEETGISADLCDTVAQDMNSVVFGDLDFTITPTALSPGDILDIRIHVAINDGATATVVNGCIGAAQLLCDVKG